MKIGGSLLTNKAGYCELNSARIVALGRELAALDKHLRRRLIVLLGGGSFSHGISLRYGLVNTRPSAARRDFSRLTLGLFSMMSTVIDLWRSAGIAAYPIQAAAATRIASDQLRLSADHFLTCIANQLTPVTTGDVALLPDGSSHLLSADWLPVLLAREIRIARVVFVTDVPGILNRDTGVSIPIVSLRSPEVARASTGSSSHPDVSGGMAGKLEAALALAALGVNSRIVDGRETGALRGALSGAECLGTEVVA